MRWLLALLVLALPAAAEEEVVLGLSSDRVAITATFDGDDILVFGAVKRMVVSSNVEKSRREIAAYIAEGSMTPEDGERLLKAGKSESRCG